MRYKKLKWQVKLENFAECQLTKTERKHKPNIDTHEENHLGIILKREKRELLARK